MDNSASSEHGGYSHIPSTKEALLSPYTWIAGASMVIGIIGPAYYHGSVDAAISASVGAIGFVVADAIVDWRFGK